MPRGGYRPGGGRPKGSKNKRTIAAEAAQPVAPEPTEERTPLEYMLAVMNDPTASPERRDRMAIAAASFVHKRGEEITPGKRAQAQQGAREVVAGGRYAPRLPPRLVVDNAG